MFSFVNMKNEVLKELFLDEWYADMKFNKVTGRYVHNSHLDLVREDFQKDFEIEILGRSVGNRPIFGFKIGSGEKKVLAWSQMHGNESTTTKAVFDFLNALSKKSQVPVISEILKHCSLYIIPILNPDGAKMYTRVNASEVDLNRDLQNLSQPESKLLKKQYDLVKPDFCLNLHDQRTIFSAGKTPEPAVLSFLTPSRDMERNIDDSRKQSMGLIAGIARDLSAQLRGKIGRYDDAFNLNCAGDTFQYLGTPTLLFEAGHYPGDYEREETRKYVFRALLSCLYQIASQDDFSDDYDAYFNIPENEKLFNDLVIRNAEIEGEVKDVAIQFREILLDHKIDFEPVIDKIGLNIQKYGHREIDAEKKRLSIPGVDRIFENVVVNKIILNTEEFRVKCG